MIVRAAELWGPAEDQLPAARARHRAPLEGRRELHGRDQPGRGHRPHRPRRLRLRDDHRPGQRPGRARAGPEMRSAARARATSRTRSIASTSPASGACRGVLDPAHGPVGGAARSKRSTTGEIKGLLLHLLQPGGVAAGRRLHPRSARAGSSTSRSSTSSCPRRRATPTSCLPGSLMEEDEGTTTNVEGRVIHHRQVVRPAGGRARGLADHLRPRAAARRGRQVPLSVDARDLRRAAHRVQGRRRRLLRHHVGEDRPRAWASSGRARRSITRARRASTKARSSVTRTARRTSSRSSGGRRPRSRTPSTRSS